MAKNIVLLSDGTGNSAAKLFKTNVWRLYQALDLDRSDQVAIYDDGVGTERFKPLALLGGAVGLGLRRNVLDLYTFLCRNWQPGDRIYGFGFSRGAFTIRTLVGLIASQGIVQASSEAELRERVHKAYERDRKEFRTNWGRAREWTMQRLGRGPAEAGETTDRRPWVTFLGLWDTVDAYGLPIEELKRGIDRYFRPLTFPDRRLWDNVERACHALALDDERLTFHPVLWDEGRSRNPDRIKQVWFAGAHSNVGGGYPNDALSYVPLVWIMGEAEQAKLVFKPSAVAEIRAMADPHGELHDSRAGLAAYYRYAPRKLSELCQDTYHDVTIRRPKVHESALVRIKEGRVPYAPAGLPGDYDVVRFDGSVVPLAKLTGPGGQPLYEDTMAAAGRAGTPSSVGQQERAWDHVWWRRLMYFVTVAVSVWLVTFRWVHPAAAGGGCAGRWCFVDPLLAFVAGFAPGWLTPWFDSFRSAPGMFLGWAAALALSLTVSAKMARDIGDAGETAWRHLKPRRPPVDPYRPGLVYRVRTSQPLLAVYHWITRSAMPALFALLVVVAGAAAASRGLFELGSSLGFTCPGTAGSLPAVGVAPVRIEFASNQPCQATGYRLEQGARYLFTLDVGQPASEPWTDNGIPVENVYRGFSSREAAAKHWSTPLFMYAALPLRRSLSRDWFQPIARIGTYGKDQYSISEQALRARTSGELFLFVNDAVVGVPGWWARFYENNRGRAAMTVQKVPTARERLTAQPAPRS